MLLAPSIRVSAVHIISFDPFRCLRFPVPVKYIKPDQWLHHTPAIRQAQWVLFPAYWQVNSLYYAMKKKIFPSITCYHLGQNKIEMTRAVQAIKPEHMPHTLILPSEPSAIDTIVHSLEFPMVAKVPRSSMGMGVHLISDKAELRRYAQTQPILYVQEYLPIRKDLRVVLVGGEIITAYWRIAAEGEFHNNVARGASIDYSDIPETALRLVAELAQELGIDHAGFDLAVVDQHVYFLEFNHFFGNQALNERGIRVEPHIYRHLLAQT